MDIEEIVRTQAWLAKEHFPSLPIGWFGVHEGLLCSLFVEAAYRGVGVIVDAGSFLGKSAYFLARGLRANPNYDPQRHRVHCFDSFEVYDDDTIDFVRNKFSQTVKIGDSIRPLFESQVAPFRDMLEVYAGDFNTVVWPAQPVEFLFVDLAKTVSLCGRIAELFFTNLIPGHSLVVHQDYHHPWLPHIHVVMEYLSDYFELLVPRVEDSAAFRFRRADSIANAAAGYQLRLLIR